ncbi:succinyl-diaminopimelate desuccinylase [Candidatus Vallotia tarda]|uniref:Succinyl-diaminopimelate desuccinylase n=1 Tax=Candidatus Vallotiella hemipterorum TaxID=1177213 RepID=A0A916JW68_9BURK|nr:succinyl-diaminopimelate desuccinylase [Candidatus Vallotia tarda]CAG7602281.1 Succinyl-diaminopimelate desuccinylase [Candidatus Vallotia tarda]
MSRTLALAESLISRASVTPEDKGCQTLIIERLVALGFNCTILAESGVTNLWALKRGAHGQAGKLLAFAGHTDVVPAGPMEHWSTNPFVPMRRDGRLYGRGAADMKSSLAAFIVAVEEFVSAHSEHSGSIGFLITSDEEGPARYGTIKIVEWLEARGDRLDYCVVGEPTSGERFGDTLKNGRRGSLSGVLTVRGIQGHVAYPHLAKNPVHLLAPALTDLVRVTWDQGNEYFPPTTWQVSKLHAGTSVTNMIPGSVNVGFNFRFSTATLPDELKTRTHAILDTHGLEYELTWHLSGMPFLTPRGELSSALEQAIEAETGICPTLSTTGGTSDGRFITRICRQVIEFGPCNASIHKVDEYIELSHLEPLKNVYRGVLERLIA